MTQILFTLRRSVTLTLALVLISALAACSGGGSEETEPAGTDAAGGGGGSATVEGGNVEISAENLEFSTDTITAPAGEDFTITLVNNDSAPHNLSIYTEEGGEQLALGPTGEGGQTVVTEVSALEPGEYFFVCDIHPDMTGTLVVEG